jgi:hypothetical protein
VAKAITEGRVSVSEWGTNGASRQLRVLEKREHNRDEFKWSKNTIVANKSRPFRYRTVKSYAAAV